MPGFIVPDAGARPVLFPADEQRRTPEGVGKVCLHGLRQHPESVAGDPGVPVLISVIGHHDLPHQLPAVFRRGHTVGPGFEQGFPGVVPVDRLHALEEPDLRSGDVLPLQRGGVDGDEPLELLREQLRVHLSHVAAHGLTDDHRRGDALPLQDPVQPAGLVSEIEIPVKGPGGCVLRGIPDQNPALLLKVLDLPVEQSVICRQSRQEYQRRICIPCKGICPVVDRPAARRVQSLLHIVLFRAIVL